MITRTTFLLFLNIYICMCVPEDPKCPPAEDIAPCKCEDTHTLTLDCYRATDDDLNRVFNTHFPQTNFDELTLTNGQFTSLTEIPNGLTFGDVFLEAESLSLVGNDFLVNSTDTLQTLQVPASSLTNSTFPFTTLNLYKNLTKFHLKSSDSFEGKLPQIVSDSLLSVNFAYNKITEIDTDSFSGCPRLRSVDLSSNALTSVGPRTFRLRAGEDNEVLLGLNDITEVHEEAFVLPEEDVPGETRISVYLYSNKLTSAVEQLYRPLVDLDSRPLYYHPVELTGNPIACSCGEAWLALRSPDGDQPYGAFVSGSCAGGPSFQNLQPWDFEECCPLS